MGSREQLLDSLTAHISLYHSKTAAASPSPNPSNRPALLRWFSSLSVHQRRAHLTILDANFVAILIQMEEKLRSNGCGRFIILPDLPQNDGSALPTLCYRKSEGFLSRFSELNGAERAIRDSLELFSSVEGEGKGEGGGFGRLDAACSNEGLVESLNRFVDVADEITNGEFLRGGEEAEMAADWVELGWLKAKGYYSLEEFVVNRMEVALRLAWLNCNSGKKRGAKLKERLNAAGVAANVFWRKKGCVDWWEKLDDSVKKKVYSTYLGKAARTLTADIVKGKISFSDDKMLFWNDRHKKLLRCNSDPLIERDIATSRTKSSNVRSRVKPAKDSGDLSPLYQIFNSLYILQVISTLLSAAQFGDYQKEKLFFSSLDCINSISDIIIRNLRELLMVVSLDCTKFELLGGENTDSRTKKVNEKHAVNNRKKKGKTHNKMSNPVSIPCEDNSKPSLPDKGGGAGKLCIGHQDVRRSNKFDSEVPEMDLAKGNHSSEPVKGVNNGKVRSATRKSRKERKKPKSSGSNGSEVGNCESRSIIASSAPVSSPDGTLVSDRNSRCSTFGNASNDTVTQIEKPDADSSKISTDKVKQRGDSYYSTRTDTHLCLRNNLNMGAVENGAIRPIATGNDSINSNMEADATTVETVVECNGSMPSAMRVNYAADDSGTRTKGREGECRSSRVQEQGSLGLLRIGAAPAYISYEWPNTAPTHPLNGHHPAATDRLHLDVGRNLQNHFHHSFVQTLPVRNSPIDSAYNGIISRPLPMSLDWPPTVRGVNRLVPSSACSYGSEFISRRQSSFRQSITAHNVQPGAATSEDEKTVSSELMELPDLPNPELADEHDRSWMSEEELETHAIGGMDYNQYFGGGVMYWDPSDHPGSSFSRPPSLCSDDSSWAWREADMNRDVDDMVAFSSSYSTNGLTSPSAGSFCSPFDPLGPGPLNYVMPGSEISSKVLHSSSTMTDIGTEESVSGSISNISGDGDVPTVDSLPYPILRPIIIPNMSRERSRSEFKRGYDHKSPCVPPNRRDQPRIKRPPSPVVLCVPRAPHPPPPSPVGDSRRHRGFPSVRSGSSSPRHWGVKGWFHDGVNFEETCMPMEGSEVIWPSWRNKGLPAHQMTQPLAGALLQDRLIAISQLARDQEHPDVTLPLQPPESQNNSSHKASLSNVHDILHDEINYFCKQVAAENFVRKPYINWAVKRVARSLQVLWPRSRTNIYGSNATGLSLPSSDVDLVVCLPPVRNLEPIKEAGILEGRNGIKETCLQHAARYLANQEWVKSDSLKIVENTAIPIIMLVVEVPCDLISTPSSVHNPKEEVDQVASDKGKPLKSDDAGSAESTQFSALPNWSKIGNDSNDEFKSVRLDISFKSSTHTGLQTTGLVKDLRERFPAVTPLALVLKQFLADRSLDQSYSGGLSSYCLILLITRFLQHEHHHGRPINQNYGSLLMDFLYFFGNVFEPRQMRISVQGSGVYLSRERGCNIDPLCIDDPLFLTNNVGRNCFRIHQCIKAFADAYAMLEDELTCLDNDGINDAKPTRKLLPKLIPSIGHLIQPVFEQLADLRVQVVCSPLGFARLCPDELEEQHMPPCRIGFVNYSCCLCTVDITFSDIGKWLATMVDETVDRINTHANLCVAPLCQGRCTKHACARRKRRLDI